MIQTYKVSHLVMFSVRTTVCWHHRYIICLYVCKGCIQTSGSFDELAGGCLGRPQAKYKTRLEIYLFTTNPLVRRGNRKK